MHTSTCVSKQHDTARTEACAHLGLNDGGRIALRDHDELDGDAARPPRMRVRDDCGHNGVGGLIGGVQDGHQRLGRERAPTQIPVKSVV